MTTRGHNERSYRLDALASEAREGLAKVEQGEEFSIGGWLAFGHALNEARSLFPADRDFGEWCRSANLSDRMNDHDRAAAMWAAANADQFEEARQRGNPRTIRGIHAKWKEIEAEREAERFAEEQRKMAEAREAANGAEPTQPIEPESKPDQEQVTTPAPQENMAQTPVGTGKVTTQPEPDQEPEPAPDPYGYAKLTDDAVLELANGLRADLDEEKAKRKAADAEAKSLKAQLRDFQGDDKDTVIRRLQAAVKNAENAKWKALEDRDAYHRQLHAVKKERDAALKSLAAQEVTI